MKHKIISEVAAGLVIAVVGICPVEAQTKVQTTPEQRLVQAYALEREAKPAQAIPELQALLDSKVLDAVGSGKAWNILGLAFEDMGNHAEAQHAYEQSIHMFERLPNNIGDYAAALTDLGGLYVTTGQLEQGATLRIKALHLYEKVNDHAGMARSFSDLAGIAFNQKNVKDGRKYLERAAKEARLTNNLDDDDLAAFASMQGWLAQYDRDFGAAVSSYQRSLDLWRRSHGEQYLYTGWGHMLLGKARAEAGDPTMARAEMAQGIGILGRTLNHEDARYLTAEVAYSQVLDATGDHDEAARLKLTAEQRLREVYGSQCTGCTISVAAFR